MKALRSLHGVRGGDSSPRGVFLLLHSLILRRAVFPWAVLIVSSVLVVCAWGAESHLDSWTIEHFRLASEAQRQNNLEVAAREYQLILSRNPKFAEVHQNLGIVYHQQRRYRAAAQMLQAAVSLNPGLLGAQVFLGIDRYMIQDFKGAVGPLEKALRLKPVDRQAGLYLALTYLGLDRPGKAVQQLRKTAQYYPEDVEIAYHLGEAYLEGVRQRMAQVQQAGDDSALGHWALAIAAEGKSDRVGTIKEYLKALALQPNMGELYLRVAMAFHKAGVSELAAAALQRYALLNPDWDGVSPSLHAIASESSGDDVVISQHRDSFRRLWESLPAVEPARAWPGIADESVNRATRKCLASTAGAAVKAAVKLYLKGDYRGAAAKIKKRGRLTCQTEDWALAYLQARAYFLASDFDAAEQVLEGQLQPYSHLPSVALLRAEIQAQLGLRYFGLVLAKEPNSDRAKLILAKSHAAAGRSKEAIAAYQEVLKQAPERLGIHLAIAQLHEDELNWTAAIEELKVELALAPDNALALAHLGHAYTESREADQAIQILSKLLETHPNDGRAYADLGRAWTMKENAAKAIEAFKRALLNDPAQHNLHYRLFQLYSKMGDKVSAQTHLAAFQVGETESRQKRSEALANLSQE
ncbi:MAG: tetratricopeptide repeat protein [Acidobacteria bacterium]|nr:tetratricopeptide repeat protein [Acidobacteriota bacterium]